MCALRYRRLSFPKFAHTWWETFLKNRKKIIRVQYCITTHNNEFSSHNSCFARKLCCVFGIFYIVHLKKGVARLPYNYIIPFLFRMLVGRRRAPPREVLNNSSKPQRRHRPTQRSKHAASRTNARFWSAPASAFLGSDSPERKSASCCECSNLLRD